jgi:hypothetical protein
MLLKQQVKLYFLLFSLGLQNLSLGQGIYFKDSKSGFNVNINLMFGNYRSIPGLDVGYSVKGRLDLGFNFISTNEIEDIGKLHLRLIRPNVNLHVLKESGFIPVNLYAAGYLQRGYYEGDSEFTRLRSITAGSSGYGYRFVFYGRYFEDRNWYIVPQVIFDFNFRTKYLDEEIYPSGKKVHSKNTYLILNSLFKIKEDFRIGLAGGLVFYEKSQMAFMQFIFLFPTSF